MAMQNLDTKKVRLKMIQKEVYHRQHLCGPVKSQDYDALFREMSPVMTKFWTVPGAAPSLSERTEFDDLAYNDHRRREESIVKGRFANGLVAYVERREMPLFQKAFAKEIRGGMTFDEEEIYTLIQREGPMDVDIIKEIAKDTMGMKAKTVSAILQKLQKAFLIYEQQLGTSQDRAFFDFEDAFSDLDFRAYDQKEARKCLIERFAKCHLVIDEVMVKSFMKWTNKEIKGLLDAMEEENRLVKVDFPVTFAELHPDKIAKETPAYMRSEDLKDIQEKMSHKPEKDRDPFGCVDAFSKKDDFMESTWKKLFLLNLNDYLVRSHELYLQKAFGPTKDKVLFYVYTGGNFVARVLGRYTFGPSEYYKTQMLESSMQENLRKKIIDRVGQEAHDEGYMDYDGAWI